MNGVLAIHAQSAAPPPRRTVDLPRPSVRQGEGASAPLAAPSVNSAYGEHGLAPQPMQVDRASMHAVAQALNAYFDEVAKAELGEDAEAEEEGKRAADGEDSGAEFAVPMRSLHFRVNEETGRTVITVFDKRTGDVIREIPPEEAMTLAEKLNPDRGLLLDTVV